MKDTAGVRQKMLEMWGKFEKGEISSAEARVHIGFARATLDTLKVEIAAAHLSAAYIPPVTLAKPSRQINGRAARN